MHPLIRTAEILILIVVPILILFLRSNYKSKEIYLSVVILPLIWYVLYAPIHESGHILGCFAVGAEIKDYRLFAHFWEGSFGFAYVDITEGFGENMNSFVILIFPYLLDFISIILGYIILKKYKIKNYLLFGFIFMVFTVRPVYDLIDNFIGYFLNHSDFVLAGKIVGDYLLLSSIVSAFTTGIILQIILLNRLKNYPESKM